MKRFVTFFLLVLLFVLALTPELSIMSLGEQVGRNEELAVKIMQGIGIVIGVLIIVSILFFESWKKEAKNMKSNKEL